MPSRILILFILTILLAACDDDGQKEPEQQRQLNKVEKLNTVFETAEPYSPKRLDSLEMEQFLRDHQEDIPDPQAIRDFYERRDQQYAWFVDDSISESASSFLALVNSGDTLHKAVLELRDEIKEMIHPPKENEKVLDLELALTAKFFSFAAKKYDGVISEKHLPELDWYIPKRKKNYNKLLDELVSGKTDLSAIEPLGPQYARLKEQLKRYHDLKEQPWEPIALSGKKKLEPGEKANEIPAIRERLNLIGDLEQMPDSIPEPLLYDSTLVAAVKLHQQRHGFQEDGVIGPNFLRTLNTTPGDRLRTMLVNMERLRWMPEHTTSDQILVNIPAFKLLVFEADSVRMSMDVVVGTAANRTVIFSDTITYLVFSPTWTPPKSIVVNEILPSMQKDARYLQRNHMEIIGGTDALPIIQQKPGPWNSLGRVKFMFPNSYRIYLHDTPAKALFERDERAFSHGCIRLSKPVELAKYLLRNDTAWTEEKILEAMDSEEEIEVGLKEKRPLMITYFTAWVDRDGRVNFRDDIYGHDERLARELFSSGEDRAVADLSASQQVAPAQADR